MTRTASPGRDVLVDIPEGFLHPGQLEVLGDPARFKLLRAGRRWRKTGFAVVQAFFGYEGADRRYPGAFEGGQIGWWVPSMTSRYIVGDWLPIRGMAAQVPGTRIEEANHRVVLPSGGSIMMLTGDNPDSGRGLGLDGAVLEEATLLSEQLWTETIRATLVDRRGWGLFIFTPKGLNWLHGLEKAAEHKPGWRTFHYRSDENPHIDPEELEELTHDMSTLVRRQEIDAEYVTFGAGMFDRSWIRYWRAGSNEGGEPGYLLGEETFVAADDCWRFSTADLAFSQEERADYTVISTWAVTPLRHLLLLDVVRGHIDGPNLPRTFRAVHDRLRPSYFVVEKTGQGALAVVGELERSGLPIRRVRADKDKEARAIPATGRMEGGAIWFPRPADVPMIDACEAELVSFPMGEHDDFVDTLAYAVAEVARGSGQKVVQWL